MGLQVVGGIVGAAAGFYLGGPQGALYGYSIGSTLGAVATKPKGIEGPKLSDLKLTGAGYGTPIPWLRGAPRVAGVVWWSSAKRQISNTSSSGKGSGPKVTTYTYEVDVLIGMCENEVAAIARIWSNGKLVYTQRADADAGSLAASGDTNLWSRLTFYHGDATQLPDPTYEAAVGTANAPAYRGRAYAFFEGLQLGSDGQLPNLTFEVAVAATEIAFSSAIFNAPLVADDSDGAASPATATVLHPEKIGYSTSGATFTAFAVGDSVRITWSGAKLSSTLAAYDGERVTVSCEAEFTSTGSGNGDLTPFFRYIPSGANQVAWCVKMVGGTLRLFSYHVIASAETTEDHGAVYGTTFAIAFTADGASIEFLIDNVVVRTVVRARFGANPTEIMCELARHGFNGAATAIIKNARMYVGDFYEANTFDPGTQTIRAVVEDLCERAGMPAGTYDASGLDTITKTVRALAVADVSPTRSTLDQLTSAYFFDCTLADKLYFRPRGGAAVVTIPYADLAAGLERAADEPLALLYGSDLELPPQVFLQYINVSDDHQVGSEGSSRIVASQAAAKTVQLALGFTPAEAKGIADTIVADAVSGLVTTKIALPLNYSRLEPGDVVAVTDDDAASYRLRLVRRNESDNVLSFEAVVDDASALTSSETTSSDYEISNTVVALAATTISLLDIPLLRDADNGPGYYVAAKGTTTNWPGATVLSSVNNTDFSQVAEIAELAVFGTCTTTLATYTGIGFDEVNSVTVNVGSGALSSSTRAAMLADETINAMLIGSEVIRFRTATGSAGVYVLSGLLRGQRGTEWAIGTHAASERCVLLRVSGGLRHVATQTSDTGQVRYVKGVTLGALASSATAESFTNTGIEEKPFAPVDLRASKDPFIGEVTITWKRRTRFSTRLVGPSGISVPLGEASESYRVRIYSDAGYTTLKRALTATSESAAYTQAQQVADFSSASATFYVKVAQVSASVGAGYEASAMVSLSSSVAGTTALSPVLFAASGSGWLACTTAYQTSGTTGIVNDQRVTSFWKSATPGGAYTLNRSVTTLTSAPATAPVFAPVLGRIAQTSTYVLGMEVATTSVFRRALLDLSADPAVVTTSITFTAPRILAGEAARFLLFGETSDVYSSADGVTWASVGAMAGATFPHDIGDASYLTHGIQKIGSRWFLVFGLGGGLGANADRLFYSDHADAQTGWTAVTGLTVGVNEALHEQVVYDGSRHYAAVVAVAAGTSTIYASSDGGVTWASEYTTATSTGFEVATSGTTAPLMAHFQVTGTTGSDYVRAYTVNGVVYEKLVGTTSWSAKASGLVNPSIGFDVAGATAFYDLGAVFTAQGSQVRFETAGVCAVATGF